MGRDVVERLGGLDRIEHVGRRDGGRKRSEPFGVVRWTVVGPVAAEPEDLAPVFLGEQEQRARVTRPGADSTNSSPSSASAGRERGRLA